MKKISLALAVLIVSLFAIVSCTKINEPTTLGGSLIPGVDNIHTFETFLDVKAGNFLYNDTTKVLSSDLVALGDINDPEFGKVHANFCFNLAAPSYGAYPFAPRKDTTHTIDSVILSLAYSGAYGDTVGNGIQTVSVYEIPYSGLQTSLRSDTVYRYNDPSSDFSGNFLGSSTYTIRNLQDSITVTNPGDTFKTANVVRIPLNVSLGAKLVGLDTTSGIGGYANDSLFRTFFNGLSVKSANSGNALSYFSLTDTATKLTVYYRYKLNGKDTTAIVEYHHTANGQSNYVNVSPGGNWANYLNNTAANDKIYLQSSPSGSYAGIKIPALDTFQNKVIHRAEIIANVISSSSQFSPPPRLILDRIHHNGTDTAFLLQSDISASSTGAISFTEFGGVLSNDNAYHMNISRYVQSIVTKHEPNDSLRLYAPFRTILFASNLNSNIAVTVNSRIAQGRVIFAGGNYPLNPTIRLRLRIVYSNL